MQTKTFIQKLCSKYIWLNLVLMAAVVAMLVAGVFYGTALYTHHGEIIKVPDLRNKRFSDAERLLGNSNLSIVVTDTGYNRMLPPDCILQQQPLPGAEVKSGRVVYVTINSDKKPTMVLPDIVDNCSEREAQAKLSILGFKIGPTQYVAGEKGWVYGVLCRGRNINSGEKVPAEAMVILQVGNGGLDSTDGIEVTDAVYEDEVDEAVTDEDPFEEILVE